MTTLNIGQLQFDTATQAFKFAPIPEPLITPGNTIWLRGMNGPYRVRIMAIHHQGNDAVVVYRRPWSWFRHTAQINSFRRRVIGE